MSELAKTYEPNAVEAKWYDFWLEHDCFKADPARVSEQRPAYSIVIPPPNVTGLLTLGHVLNNTIQDILARRARMLGKEVLWLPGTDHAGIATQNVVEKTLRKEGAMKHRDDLGREALVAKIWEWKEKYGGIIIQQLKKLGASCDWSRERFTMDPAYSQCVSRVFVDLYKKGLIYRGKRMVNWCPASLTALSDEEVEMREQNSTLYFFKVEIAEHPDTWLTIATTRPETIPGDTAIAVNPKDERYAKFIGKSAVRPLPAEMPREKRLIPIIGDEHVEEKFGTGVLKVTPAHDKADFEIYTRADIRSFRGDDEHPRLGKPIEVIGPDGTMTANAGSSLAGLDRSEARTVAAEQLRDLGFLVKEEPYKNNVGFSERGQVQIESRLSWQWFLKYPSVAEAKDCVADERMKFFPERWAKVYEHWLGNIQDWCISRQLWWGHRVPAWSGFLTDEVASKLRPEVANKLIGGPVPEANRQEYYKASFVLNSAIEKEITVSLSGVATHETSFSYANRSEMPVSRSEVADWVFASTSSELEARELENLGFTQDSDVLDTWFSSWLWPFATMGWPDKTDTLAKFYPTTDLVTGPDIIFFWVARMIMAGFEYMGELPFRNVYFTGIIRDKQGRKMSKSLGNSPDPLDLIARYGADALRFGVMRSAPLGADILFDEKNVELGRNFCTKLWNAARFRQMQGGTTEGEIQPDLLTSDDRWILARLDAAVREVTTALEEYRFSDATATLYRFFWNEYCDWYLEATKAAFKKEGSGSAETPGAASESNGESLPPAHFLNPKLAANTLAVMDFVYAHTLRLFHPFLPFITEELWHGLSFHDDLPTGQGGQTIMTAPWPKPMADDERAYFGLDETAEKFAAAKYEVVNLGRSLRRDFNIASNKRVRFVLRPHAPLAPHDIEVLQILLSADPFEVPTEYSAPKGTPVALTPLGDLFLPLEGLIDVAAERERLAKELTKVEQELTKVRAKLADPNFAGKVPAKVLDEHRQRESDWAEKHAQLTKMRDALGAA